MKQVEALRKWDPSDLPRWLDEEFYRREILPRVSELTVKKAGIAIDLFHIKIDLIKCIGKESNSLEDVDEGMVHSEQNVYTDYTDPKRSEWITKIQPALKKPKLRVLIQGLWELALAARTY
jgi:hypothetical protein